jgi:hypothetical protein
VLARRPEKRAEAIEQLQIAARGFPSAHRTLADVYMMAGEIDLAKQEAQRYLATGPGGGGEMDLVAALKIRSRAGRGP